MTFVDPTEPPEAAERMKAMNLKNKVCLFRPTSLGEFDPKEGKTKGDTYVECDVWVLDRAGIVEEGTGVRVGWWRAVEQLKPQMGDYVLAMPVEQEDRSVVLIKTSKEEWRKLAAEAVATIAGTGTPVQTGNQQSPEDEFLDGTEPF